MTSVYIRIDFTVYSDRHGPPPCGFSDLTLESGAFGLCFSCDYPKNPMRDAYENIMETRPTQDG